MSVTRKPHKHHSRRTFGRASLLCALVCTMTFKDLSRNALVWQKPEVCLDYKRNKYVFRSVFRHLDGYEVLAELPRTITKASQGCVMYDSQQDKWPFSIKPTLTHKSVIIHCKTARSAIFPVANFSCSLDRLMSHCLLYTSPSPRD